MIDLTITLGESMHPFMTGYELIAYVKGLWPMCKRCLVFIAWAAVVAVALAYVGFIVVFYLLFLGVWADTVQILIWMR